MNFMLTSKPFIQIMKEEQDKHICVVCNNHCSTRMLLCAHDSFLGNDVICLFMRCCNIFPCNDNPFVDLGWDIVTACDNQLVPGRMLSMEFLIVDNAAANDGRQLLLVRRNS